MDSTNIFSYLFIIYCKIESMSNLVFVLFSF